MHHVQAGTVEALFWSEEVVQPHQAVSHTEHVVSYQVAGTLRMDQGQILETGPGMITILPSGAPHRSLGGRNVGLWLVGFCAVCHELNETHPLMNMFRRVRLGALPVVPLPPERHPYFVGLLEALKKETEQHTPETPVVIRSLLMLVLAEVSRAMRGHDQEMLQPRGSLTADALAFIQAHCLTPISLKDVAAAVNRTPAHVTAVLKKNTGFSAGQWITAGRLGEAAMRLAHTDDSLEIIAESVGWADVTHFIRQFRKAHGQTPAAWRARTRTPSQI